METFLSLLFYLAVFLTVSGVLSILRLAWIATFAEYYCSKATRRAEKANKRYKAQMDYEWELKKALQEKKRLQQEWAGVPDGALSRTQNREPQPNDHSLSIGKTKRRIFLDKGEE